MYISVLIQMILMEDNILQPGAEEKTKPQIKNQKNLEQKKEKKKTHLEIGIILIGNCSRHVSPSKMS